MIEEAYEKTEAMLKEHMDKLHLIAAALIEKETLEAFELEQLMKDGQITERPVEADNDEPKPPSVSAIPVADAEPGPKVVYNVPEASGGNA